MRVCGPQVPRLAFFTAFFFGADSFSLCAVSKKAPAERLSSPAQALLEEYALQFGISPLFRQQAILDALAEHFSPSLHHIRHTLKALQDLAELLPESYAR